MADDSTLWRSRIFGAIALVLALAWPVAAGAQDSDLDALMARVLERRKETWRVLSDYVLDERERFALVGPADLRLYGSDRAYTWYVRDGVLVRSPVKVNGVTVPEAERRAYEDKWLAEEQAKAAKPAGAQGDTSEGAPAAADPGQTSAAGVTKSLEPRFVSEAYFLRFRFERGRYFLAGRETLDGRPVLKVEYYPTNLFRDESEQKRREEERVKAKAKAQAEAEAEAAAAAPDGKKKKKQGDREIAIKLEADIDRKFNKVALVTLWIDQAEAQIVRYDFENLGLDFLPAQWFVRVGETTASMTMGRYFDGVWLPKSISMHGDVQLALGTFDVEYGREFLDYRKAETAARIRAYGDVR